MRLNATLLTAAALVAAGCGTTTAQDSGAARQHAQAARTTALPPPLPPGSDFVRTIDNPWFPLKPGTVLTSKGKDEGTPATDIFRVTDRTRRILGIRAIVIDDRVYENGRLSERTHDYYAQDKRGNVWYLGERTAAFPGHGRVDRSGSWLAGRHDAEPGLVMTAHPRVPQAYRQEYLKGAAEDTAWTVIRGGTFAGRARAFRHILVSLEFTRLEPGVIDQKIYAPGIGIVLERAVRGPAETARLVRVTG